MKILVTGGAGFIGSNFVHYMLRKYPDYKISIVDALTYAGDRDRLKTVEDKIAFHQADICDTTTMDRLMADIDWVAHFAAHSHVDRSIADPGPFLRSNVIGTDVLARVALKHGVKRFHHVSTDEVFGSLELGSSEKFNEQTPYNPRIPYSASKAASDHLVRAYGHTYGLQYTISNCSNNYGPYMFPEKLFSLAITNLLEGRKVPVYTPGNQVRDWLFVYDHCSAI